MRDGGRDWTGSQGPAGSLAPITVPCTSAAILLSTECVREPRPHTHTLHTEHHCGSNKNFTNSLKLLPSPAIPINLYLIFSVSRVSFLRLFPSTFFFLPLLPSCFRSRTSIAICQRKMGLDVAWLLAQGIHPATLLSTPQPFLLSHPPVPPSSLGALTPSMCVILKWSECPSALPSSLFLSIAFAPPPVFL